MRISRRRFVTRVLPGATLAFVARPARASAGASFDHGVASGDPTASGILLWTRVTPRFDASVEVAWQVARDPDFTHIVKRGTTATVIERDYTVKVDVDGLDPGSTYFYRFEALGATSQTGRTKTLPAGPLDQFVFGVCSCSNYPAGYFNAYRQMAQTDAIDAVLHLGDYIYEYDKTGYATENSRQLHRVSKPGHEIVSLTDYRMRHAQYKSDPDLQAVHARHPFIVTWDDHESANDAWHTGAQNHDESEGSWLARREAAVRAYYEWMPIRESEPRESLDIYRSFEIGDLATLVMLETRLGARTKQVDLGETMTYRQIDFDFSNPDSPVPLTDERRAVVDPASVRAITVPFDVRGERPAPMTDYAMLSKLTPDTLPEGFAYLPDGQRFRREVLTDPSLRLFSDAQRKFIQGTLEQSRKDDKPWQVIGNQTLMAQITAPNLADGMSEEEVAALPDYIRRNVAVTRFDMPLGSDNWNGYAAERQWLCDQFAETGASPIVVTGDSHAAWALDVINDRTAETAALELATTSISSPGFTESLGIESRRIETMLFDANDNLHYSGVSSRGFLSLRLTHEGAEATYNVVDTVGSMRFTPSVAKRIPIEHRPGKAPVWG